MSDQNLHVSGSCLCGALSFTVDLKNTDVGTCHCGMCRKWSGGALMMLECDSDPAFENTEALGVYRASDWGERGFCRTCGTSLFWRMQDGSHISVSVASLDGVQHLRLANEIFIDEKPDYYNFAEPTHKMTGAEVIAMFAPEAK
ncbi:MAG TPA: GFA family protein [Hyphomicrobiaceae bacterium]|nr:GFA family protein [Hyphomicrobiaceae bacterium]